MAKNYKEKTLKIIAQQIKTKRKEKGMSQFQLAKKAGVSQSSIRNWEKGETDMYSIYLIRLAKILDINLYELAHLYEE